MMNLDTLRKIIEQEGLEQPILYGEGNRENAVVLEKSDDEWIVYLTSERAGVFENTLRHFDNESAALDYVLVKLRQAKTVHASLQALEKKRVPVHPTHIQEINASARAAFTQGNRTYPDKILYTLQQMNGSSFWGYRLWRAPEGIDLMSEQPSSEEYIECFGSADAMTIRVRILDPDDTTVAYQFIVGKPGEYKYEPTRILVWNEGRESTTVYNEELFTADEAAIVLYTYFETGGVTRFYHLREMAVTENVTTLPETYDVTNLNVPAQRLNQAIIGYLGKGHSSHPLYDEAAVKAFTSEVEAEGLLSKVKTIVDGCASVEIDWSTRSLAEAGEEVRRVMTARYPELSETAIDALCWMFTYNNK